MIKVGIVGLGKMGILHAGILNALPGCNVVSLVETESLLVRFAKRLLPDLKFYSRVEDMVDNENLDAVYVATPISSHLPVMERIASTSKRTAVFVEKPLAGSYDDAKRIADLAAKLKMPSMVGFQKRFSPIFQKARNTILSEALGELTTFSAYSYVSGVSSKGKGWRFKAGQGGALLDLGPHLIDLLLWYFGEPVDVKGDTWTNISKEVDDTARGALRFSSGLAGSFDVSWSIEGYRLPEIGITVVGNNGKLHVTDDHLRLELYSDSADINAGMYHFQKPEFEKGVDFLIGDPEYCVEDKYFANCVLNAKSPEPDFGAGLRVNQVIERIRNSARGVGVA